MNEWRNAIAHQNFDAKKFGTQFTLYLNMVKQMRKASTELAEEIDTILGNQLTAITGKAPW